MNTLFRALFLVLLSLSFINAKAGSANVYMYGAVIEEACVIPPGEENITLDFGSIVDTYLYQNTRTPSETFTINLTECDLSVASTVTMTFIGVESVALPGLLAPDVGAGGSGIAVGLETSDGKPLPLNTPSRKVRLQPGSNAIVMNAYVQGEPDAITNHTIARGAFTATATFNLDYE
jgi:type 1 fimbria pilin